MQMVLPWVERWLQCWVWLTVTGQKPQKLALCYPGLSPGEVAV